MTTKLTKKYTLTLKQTMWWKLKILKVKKKALLGKIVRARVLNVTEQETILKGMQKKTYHRNKHATQQKKTTHKIYIVREKTKK